MIIPKASCPNYTVTDCCPEHMKTQAFSSELLRICSALITLIMHDGRLFPREVVEGMEIIRAIQEVELQGNIMTE